MSHFRTGHSGSCLCERCEESQPTAADWDDLRTKLSASEAECERLRLEKKSASSAQVEDIGGDVAKTDCSVDGCGDYARTYGLCYDHAAAAGRDAKMAGHR